jgi:hypothetical protein
MYDPIQDGIDKTALSVRYAVEKPPTHLSSVVHCYWELKTEAPLEEEFCLHAVPDACVNILFNQAETEIAGVTALRTTFEVLNLGKSFHYVGIQLLPGVWQGNPQEIADQFVGTPYSGVCRDKSRSAFGWGSRQKARTVATACVMPVPNGSLKSTAQQLAQATVKPRFGFRTWRPKLSLT